MAINTIGENPKVTGIIYQDQSVTKTFSARAGDVITIDSLPSTYGTPMSRHQISTTGGLYGTYNGYTFTAQNSFSGLTISCPPQIEENSTVVTVTAGTGGHTNIATDNVATVVAASTSGLTTSFAYSTNSGASWSSTGAIASGAWGRILYDTTVARWVVWNHTGTTQPYSSANLAGTWAAGTGGVFTTAMGIGAAGGGVYVLGTGTSTAGNVSTNGTSWTSVTFPVAFNRLKFVNGLFIATVFNSSATSLYTSTNGSTWTARAISFTNSWVDSVTIGEGFDIVYNPNDGVWYAFGYTPNSTTRYAAGQEIGSGMLTSTNGTTWVLGDGFTGFTAWGGSNNTSNLYYDKWFVSFGNGGRIGFYPTMQSINGAGNGLYIYAVNASIGTPQAVYIAGSGTLVWVSAPSQISWYAKTPLGLTPSGSTKFSITNSTKRDFE